EDQRVAALGQQRLDPAAQQSAGARAVQLAGLDLFHQPRTGLGDHPHVAGEAVQQGGELGALQGAGGGQHADHAAAGGRGRRLHRRFHADDRQLRVALAQVSHRRRGGGVAGQHQRLGALLQEKPGDLLAALANELRTLLAIGHMTAVGDVEQRLLRQPRANLVQHREAADAGVEHADRRRVHGRPPHTLQAGSRRTFSSRKREPRASTSSRRPTSGSPKPASSLSASSACRLPTSPTSGPATPASLQVSSASLPWPYRQWEQGLAASRGSTAASWPSRRIAAPDTSGRPVATQAALTAARVVKLSEQSSTRSTAATAAARQSSSSAARCGTSLTCGLSAASRAMAESTLATPTWLPSWMICRCRLVRSTESKSARCSSPTPAAARYRAT